MNTCSCGFFISILLCAMLLGIAFGYSAVAQESSAVPSPSCKHVEHALHQAETLLQRLGKSSSRDSSTVKSLVQYTRTAHDSALACKNHLSAMMFLATSEAAKKLFVAENILLFRLHVRDVQLFLAEARKYWAAHDSPKSNIRE
ncbi:MAG: hypothetical protein EAZ92_07065 [Candidatus Kapaibacterium sp.]|nr:MAG: hypothetical protein EAZ92_07065 [Candidatus Kapabacteria bacterium]